jgi:hypothetical protein
MYATHVRHKKAIGLGGRILNKLAVVIPMKIGIHGTVQHRMDTGFRRYDKLLVILVGSGIGINN